MEKTDGCSKWHSRHISKAKRMKIAVNSIPEIYKKIAVIEEIIKEDAELRKIFDETDDTDD